MAKAYRIDLLINTRQAEEAAAKAARAQQLIAAEALKAARAAEASGDAQAKAADRVGVSLAQLQSRAIEFGQKWRESQRQANADVWAGTFKMTAVAAAALAQAFDSVEADARKAASGVQAYREQMGQLMALKNGIGSTPAISQDLLFRRATLMSRDESILFNEAARGIGESSIDTPDQQRLISQAEFEKGMAKAAAIGTVKKVEPASAGTLAGQLPAIFGRRMSGDEVAQEFAKLQGVFQPGGAGPDSLTKQFSGVASYAMSGVTSPEELAALLSAFSTTKPQEAGTMVRHFIRATAGGIDKNRKAGVEGSESTGAYYKQLGITEQMTPEAIGRRIVADLEDQRVKVEAKGDRFDAAKYLERHGYGNIQDRESILAFQGLLRSGRYDKTFKPLSTNLPTMAQVDATIAEGQADERFLSRKTGLMTELAGIKLGAGPEEAYQALRKAAFEKLKAEGAAGVTGEFENFGFLSNLWANPLQFIGTASVDREMVRMMDESRAKAGLMPMERIYLLDISGPGSTTASFKRAIGRSSMEVQARGGDPLTPSLDALLDVATKHLASHQEMVRLLREQNRQPATAPPAFRRQ